MDRKAKISRKTAETNVDLVFEIDGLGKSSIDTGIGFFDHMLTLFTKHGLFNLNVKVVGDLDVDFHHSVEDVGICLGQAFQKAISDGAQINRYASSLIPMDEALCQVAIDVSNRPYLGFVAKFSKEYVGQFDAELVEEFFRAFVNNARINLHIELKKGSNLHHEIESIFKAVGVCLDQATKIDDRKTGIPSTKGVL